MKPFDADKMLAEEIARAQRTQQTGKGRDMKDDEVYKKLSADFPAEAMSEDSSRGFSLTSIKAQYIVERLNECFGIMNWTFGGEFKDTADGVIYLGALVVTVGDKQNKQFAPGFSANKKNLGDTYKSAQTDSLSKCASKFGVGNAVFKGLVNPKNLSGKSAEAKPAQAARPVAATVPAAQATEAAPAKATVAPAAKATQAEATPTSFKTRSSRRTRPEASTQDDI